MTDQPTPATAEPPTEFDKHQLVLLRRPADAPDLDPAEVERLQALHLGHLAAMKDAGFVKVSGPLEDQPDESWRGICLYQTGSLVEARRLAELDPAVRAGRLEIEVMTWLTPKCALRF
jgi:uncharacterized protein YciI